MICAPGAPPKLPASLQMQKNPYIYGAPGTIRTSDPQIRSLMLLRGAKPTVKSSPPIQFVSNFAGMTVHSQSVERLPQGSPGLTTL